MKKYIFILLVTFGFGACNENDFLKEEVKSFYVIDNSYVTTEQFRQALNFLYDNIRELNFRQGDQTVTMYFSDLAFGGTDYPDGKFNNFNTWLTPDTYIPGVFWSQAYSAISNASVIIDRIALTDEVSDGDKASIKGEALFFRAYWTNFLGNMFGGVPIVISETAGPRRDYVQSTRVEVYTQAKNDLVEAVSLLSDIDKVEDGKVSKQVAQHVLAEVYISLEMYDEAIATASDVIDHPATGLMTSRFGSRKSEPGDPYWDLFQYNNQNRSSGNTEGLLVMQYEYKSSGSDYGCDKPRFFSPLYFQVNVAAADGGNPVPASTTHTQEKGGRGIGVVHPTDYFLYDIWGSDFDTDLRNSSRMIQRDWLIDNPLAAGYGEYLIADGWLDESKYAVRHAYPIVMKFIRTDNQIPDDALSGVKTAFGEREGAYSWGSLGGNSSLKDEYLIRLAGTYLLRAEAYWRKGNNPEAAADINALRTRANASLVSAADVNLDLILDESMKELYLEDFRLPTLCRTGTFYDRVQRSNSPTKHNVSPRHNLWPIPYSEIERNTFGTIEQNPGYTGS